MDHGSRLGTTDTATGYIAFRCAETPGETNPQENDLTTGKEKR